MCNPSQSKKNAGFTLLEVMLAVAIVGTALFTIVLAIGQCMDGARKANSYSTAHELADQKLQEFSNPTNFVFGVSSGDFGTDYPGFQWKREVTQEDNQFDALYRQTLAVTWRERGRDYDVTLTTLLYTTNSTSDTTSTSSSGATTR